MRDDDCVITGMARRPWARVALVGSVAVALLVWVAGGAAWGQSRMQGADRAKGQERSGQPQEVALDVPIDDLDRGTPRRAVEGFLRATGEKDYQRAAGYLDLRSLPAGQAKIQGPGLARHLRIVLDQALPVDVEALSDSPDGYLQDGLPADLEQLGRIDIAGAPIHIRLRRVPREDGVRIWQVSATTVSAIPGLYKRYAYGVLGDWLPSVFFETEFLGAQLRQWVALPIIVGLGYALSVLATTLGLRLVRRQRDELASVLSRSWWDRYGS
jgi:MscS family membrane protein